MVYQYKKKKRVVYYVKLEMCTLLLLYDVSIIKTLTLTCSYIYLLFRYLENGITVDSKRY